MYQPRDDQEVKRHNSLKYYFNRENFVTGNACRCYTISLKYYFNCGKIGCNLYSKIIGCTSNGDDQDVNHHNSLKYYFNREIFVTGNARRCYIISFKYYFNCGKIGCNLYSKIIGCTSYCDYQDVNHHNSLKYYFNREIFVTGNACR